MDRDIKGPVLCTLEVEKEKLTVEDCWSSEGERMWPHCARAGGKHNVREI